MTTGFAPQEPSDLIPANSAAANKCGILQDTLLEHFSQLRDPRIDRTKAHLLLDIIAIAVLAVVAGADGWEAIETFGHSRQAWKAYVSQFA